MRPSRGMGAIAPAKKPKKAKMKIPAIGGMGGISGIEGSGIKKMASGGAVSGSKRDGCARKGRTNGKIV